MCLEKKISQEIELYNSSNLTTQTQRKQHSKISTTNRYTVCLIQNLFFQGFEASKEYIASQGKFHINKIISFFIQCIITYMYMYVVDRYLLLHLKVLLNYFGKNQHCFFRSSY